MSPTRIAAQSGPAVDATLRRVRGDVARRIRDERLVKRWSVAQLADDAGLSRWIVYLAERGDPISLEAIARIADSLRLRLEIDLVDPRRRAAPSQHQTDLVHAAMGEFEVAHFRPFGFPLALDEPYQHFHFAGRADLIAWEVEQRALLHIENWTRFPDFQEMAGSFNSKRAYLGKVLADRLGIAHGWRSETHVIAALWSSEVIHQLRLRAESFHALCPDDADSFTSWWLGAPPTSGRSTTFIVIDPLSAGRQRQYASLDAALKADPRYRGYADAASAILNDRG